MRYSYSLDVSGSVNATAIVAGGSTAKQIDCGSLTVASAGSSVSFNFTFVNAPKVMCTMGSLASPNTVTTYMAYNITTTGFTLKGFYYYAPGPAYGNAADIVNWIAIG